MALDLRRQFQERIHRFIQDYEFDQSQNLCDEPRVFKAYGGFADVYQGYLRVNMKKVKVTFKQLRINLCENGNLPEVC